MRIGTIFILVLLTISCSKKNEAEVKKVIRTPLTLADLKFPLIDEDNWMQSLPRPNKENIIQNRIKASVPEIQIDDIHSYPKIVQSRYCNDIKSEKISFCDWLARNYFYRDTNYYDRDGNLTDCKHRGFMGSHWKFTYDSLGYKIQEEGGSDVYGVIKLRYSLNNDNTLICGAYEGRSHRVKNLNRLKGYMHYLFTMRPEVYQFDSLGYLVSTSGFDPDPEYACFYLQTFTYTKDHKISAVEKYFHALPSSSFSYAPFGDGTPDVKTTKYYYHKDQLDSVVTYSQYIKDSKINRYRRTYYDARGLPVRTKFDNYYKGYLAKCVVYRYIQY